jgi:hypothetical protein
MKEPNMKIRRSLFTAVILAGVGCLPSLATAQTVISASTTTSTSTLSTTTSTATSALVTIKGAVIGAPENVNFSGQAQVNARVVTDPDFGNPPTVVLSIDLANVTGTGASTGRKYLISSQQTLNRKLNAADWVQVTFPFYASGASPASSRVGSASFSLGYDVRSLKLTGVSGQIATP